MSVDVSFNDTSTPGPSGPITDWAWDFGDGNTSTDQSPVHTYSADGTYAARLTVTGTGDDGQSTVTHSVAVSSGGNLFSTPVPVLSVLFEDEFDGVAGTKPDSAKWSFHTGSANLAPVVWDGNTQTELDGSSHLKITAHDVSGTWHSAFLTGKTSYSGPRYIEARAKMAGGAGTWNGPIWEWKFPSGGAPQFENDVNEQLGREPTKYHSTLHNWTAPGVNTASGKVTDTHVDLSADYHQYGSAIYHDHVDFYFDGQKVATTAASAIGLSELATQAMALNINFYIGGGWAGPPADTTDKTMYVDYVRVWELDLAGGITSSIPLGPPIGKMWYGSSASSSIHYSAVESSILNGSRSLDIAHTYKRLDSYDSSSFPGNGDDGTSMQTQFDAGKILFYNFAFKIGGVVPDGTSTWSNLAAGSYDTQLGNIADKIAAWSAGHSNAKVFVSWEAEMDRRIGTSGTSASQFASAWRHIHDLFVSHGARTACVFVFAPTGYQNKPHLWGSLYPGDTYVDWLGYDPYGKVDPATGAPDATAHNSLGEDEQDSSVDDTGIYRFYKWATGVGAKDTSDSLIYRKAGSTTMPIMVCETGISYNAGADAAFLAQYRTWWSDLRTLFSNNRYPHIRAWVFFPSIDSYDPRLDVGSGSVSTPQAGSMLDSFRKMAALSRLNP